MVSEQLLPEHACVHSLLQQAGNAAAEKLDCIHRFDSHAVMLHETRPHSRLGLTLMQCR